MVKITFQDGTKVNIAGNPTPEQINAVWEDIKKKKGPAKSALKQTVSDVKSGAKAFVGDIKSTFTGKPQKEEDKGLLSRTFDRFGKAGDDIADAGREYINQSKEIIKGGVQMSELPQAVRNAEDVAKKTLINVSRPLTGTMGDVLTTGVKTLATDQRVQEVKDLIQSEPVQWTAEQVKKIADIVVPNKTDQEFILEMSNWIPVPIIDDILSGAFRGAKYVPEAGTKIRGGVSPEGALPLGEGLKTAGENLTSGIVETAANAGKGIVNTAAERTLTLANPDWRIGKVATRDIKQATGKTPAQFALENGVIDADSAKNFHYSNLEKKIDLIKDFGQTQKDIFSTSMAESLLKQIDDISKDIKITNPEIIKARENLERFINTENPTFAQKDAIKSLYDLQNPDNLKFDIRGKPEQAPKHQEAAFRRGEVQKEIEARGKELGLDVAKINKDIQASYALEKGLRNRAEVLDANTGIGWQDSQLGVLATLAGGLDAGTAAILFKKLLLDNSSFRGRIAKKMYIGANENRTLTSWAGDPPSNRSRRLVNTIGDNPTGNITVPINGKTGVGLAKTFERGYTLKDGQIDKPFGIKEALEDFKKLPLQEQAAAVAESPALARVVEIDEVMTTLPKGLFGSKVPPQEIVSYLRPITEKIINKEYTPQELDFISESAPKEAQMELRRAYENTKLIGYKTDAELADAPAKTPQDLLTDELKEVTRIAVAQTGRKAIAVSDYLYRDFIGGKKDMNEIFNLMDANDMNPDPLAQKIIVDGYNRFMRRLDDEKITVAENGTADISRQRLPEEAIRKPSEPYKNPDKPDNADYKDYKTVEEIERNYLVKKGLTKRQAENAIREFGSGVDEAELLTGKIAMLETSLKNNGKSVDEIQAIIDDYVNDMNTQGLDEGAIGEGDLQSLQDIADTQPAPLETGEMPDMPEVKEMGGLPKTTKFETLETRRKSLVEKVNNKDLTTEERVIATRDMYETMLDQYKIMGKQDKIPELKAQIKEINKVIEDRGYFDLDVDKIKKLQSNVLKDENKASETLSELKKKYGDTPTPKEGGVEKFRTAVDAQNTQLTTKIIKQLGERESVSKEFINNMTNQGDIKQIEKDIIRELLKSEGDKVNVADFKKKVQAELLPLKVLGDISKGETLARYENIVLPDELRGRVADYTEKIYESPVKTSAGDTHFGESPMGDEGGIENYFGHTRIEDMADGSTRRVIEVQSDLYQKGNLERERFGDIENNVEYKYSKKSLDVKTNSKAELEEARKTISDIEKEYSDRQKLQQYNDPTAHFRMIREEIKKAADDGKTKLQFPTGETAMKIEGLGEVPRWNRITSAPGSNYPTTQGRVTPDTLEVGMEISQGYDPWIITDVLGDGKFKAVQKSKIEDQLSAVFNKGNGSNENPMSIVETNKYIKDNFDEAIKSVDNRQKEEFDISGKVDTNNPIYKFYEKEVGRYLKKYDAKLVTDDKGVNWYEVNIKPEMGGDVEAFRTLGDKLGAKITPEQIGEIKAMNKKLFGDEEVDIVPQILSNKDALGSYKDGMIKILDGKADAKDTYMHEAVHKYLDAFTSEAEHLDILEYGKKKYDLDDYVEIEERIAEDFIKYSKTRTGFTGTLKLHFENIIKRIKSFFNNPDKIDSLYNDIMRGKAKGKKGKVKDAGMEKYIEDGQMFQKNVRGEPENFQDYSEMVARERFDIPNLEKVSFGGSDRDVYDLGDGRVLKVIKTARGIEQNRYSSDWYAENEGLIPKTFEVGKNYLVKEKVLPPDAKTKAMVKDIQKLLPNNEREKGYYEALNTLDEKYGIDGEDMYYFNELNNYGSILVGDFKAIRNWGTTIEGRPVLIDEGTLNGDLVKNHSTGNRNLDDPEFREIYNKSRAAKQKFGDKDDKTMYRAKKK